MQLSLSDLLKNVPHPKLRDVQQKALEVISTSKGGVLLEIPTGEGKTGIGVAILRTSSQNGEGGNFYITPTKAQAEQVERTMKEAGVDVQMMFGRAEYECLYYKVRGQHDINAHDAPCHTLCNLKESPCAHRVSQDDGETRVEGVDPCPYYQAKFEARKKLERGGIVVCTTAFYLINRLLVKGWCDLEVAMVVIDEAHRLASVARRLLEHRITDVHLTRITEAVNAVDPDQGAKLEALRKLFFRIVLKRKNRSQGLLEESEIEQLIKILNSMSPAQMQESVSLAIASGELDPQKDRRVLKLVETLVSKIPQMIRSLRFATSEHTGKSQNPLNYVIAFHESELEEDESSNGKKRVRHSLTIRSYFVVPMIKKTVGQRVVAYSATIGNEGRVFAFETGLKLLFKSYPSTFSMTNTRVFIPKDTPNLSHKARRKDSLRKAMQAVVKMITAFRDSGHRCLFIVVSEKERENFLRRAKRANLEAISYNGTTNPREAARAFAQGCGDVLVGTAAQYSEGIDLPDGMAPVIIFLRPGYPSPYDPQSQFEKKRFSKSEFWKLMQWRVMIEALQVRGRNIRRPTDKGVCIFVSQQFRRWLFHAIPIWLRPAYSDKLSVDEIIEDTLKLLA